MLTQVYIFAVMIVSSFMQTVTGFGYAIITAPLLALALGPKDTVMLTILTGFIVRLFMLRATKNDASFKAIYPLIMAAVLGVIPGAYVMTMISNDSLKMFIGFVLLLAAAALWKEYHLPIKHSRFAEAIVGGLSGFLATTTSINGPPVILYYLNSGAEENKNAFRGNLTRYFLLINVVALVMSYLTGTLQIQNLWLQTLLAVPAQYIGFLLGERFFHRLNAETFRRITLAMVVLSSVVIISSTLMK